MPGDVTRHFWITRSVARSMGLSLSDAMRHGWLTAEGYAEMVTCCSACALVEQCEHWLATQQRGAAGPPPGCANSETLARLSKMQTVR